MTNKLIAHFQKFASLAQEEIEAITESMEIRAFNKGDFLLREGQYNNDTFFLLSGFVRQYRLVEGEEVTTGFFREGQWIISLEGFTENAVSLQNLIAVEDTHVVVGNESNAQRLFRKYPRLETVSRMIMETTFAAQQKWMASYMTDSPEKRYLNLLETQVDIFQKVPQYQIASYIGVKPESLSRIRKRLLKRP